MDLVIAGHISEQPRKHQHIIELYDKRLIENICVNSLFRDNIKHVISSPGCFCNEWREAYHLEYKLITEAPALAEDFLSKNYLKYENIFMLSDLGCMPAIANGMKLRNLFMFNTVSMDMNLTYQEFCMMNFDTVDLFHAKLSISRFIEEPYKLYIFGPNRLSIVRYGMDELMSYLSSVSDTKTKVEFQLYDKQHFPSDRQAYEYNEIRKQLSIDCPPHIDESEIDILIHDKKTEELLCSYAHDNTTFAIIPPATRGTNTCKINCSYEVSKDIVKYNCILQWFKFGKFILHWDCPENILNTKYTIANSPYGHRPDRKLIKEMLDAVWPGYYENYYLIHEEGHGYYLICKDDASMHFAFDKIKLLFKDDLWGLHQITCEEQQKLLLSNHSYSLYYKMLKDIIRESSNSVILDMNSIGSDFMYKSKIGPTNIFYFSPFFKKHSDMYSGPLYPDMKYDVILFWGSYFYQDMNMRELKSYWQWLYSLLSDKGKVVITGYYELQNDKTSNTQYLMSKNKSDFLQIQHNPSYHYLGKRIARVSDGVLEITTPWIPLDCDIIEMIKAIGFKCKVHSYNRTLNLYVYEFKKGDFNESELTESSSPIIQTES